MKYSIYKVNITPEVGQTPWCIKHCLLVFFTVCNKIHNFRLLFITLELLQPSQPMSLVRPCQQLSQWP